MTHRPGKSSDIKVADCLSRLPLPSTKRKDIEDEVICLMLAQLCDSSVSLMELQKAVSEDKILTQVITYIQGIWPNKSAISSELQVFYELRDELSVVRGVVMRGEVVVVPANLTERLINLAHSSHQGMSRTKQRLREYYWWAGMDRQVEDTIRSCTVCQNNDKSAKVYTAPMKPVPFPAKPWEKLAIDIVGPNDSLPVDCRYAITLIDYHSKWPEVGFVSKVTSEIVIKFLNSVFSREGCPEEIVSDNGSQFVSLEFEQFLKQRNIKHTCVAVYHPESNGCIERFNRVVKDTALSILLQRKPVKESMQEFLFIYRSTPHATTGFSPMELLHHCKMRTGLNVKELHDTNVSIETCELQKTVLDKQSKSKAFTDVKRSAKITKLKVGDMVRVKIDGHVRKGHKKYSKPIKITKQKGPATFVTEDGKTRNQNQLAYYPINDQSDNNNEIQNDTNQNIVPPQNFVPRRSGRNRTNPVWHQDYVMNP